jgi:hypothetical protein
MQTEQQTFLCIRFEEKRYTKKSCSAGLAGLADDHLGVGVDIGRLI